MKTILIPKHGEISIQWIVQSIVEMFQRDEVPFSYSRLNDYYNELTDDTDIDNKTYNDIEKKAMDELSNYNWKGL